MPRVGWIRPESDQRLSDHLAIAMLTTIYPPWLVDDVISESGRLEQRQRMLPARVVLYHLLAMALYEEASYEEVMRRLLEGLAWQQRWPARWQVPTKAAIFKARTRLGVEPLARLFERAVRPLARSDAPQASYRGSPVVGVDHYSFGLASAAVRGSAKGGSTTGALDVTALVEGRTHVVLDLTFDHDLASAGRTIAGRLRPGALYLSDDGLAPAALCDAAGESRAEMICPVAPDWTLTPVADLSDGSRMVDVHETGTTPSAPRTLRSLGSIEGSQGPLLTTLTDPASAPADELRDLYGERAGISDCLDDLQVHQNARAITLRSKSAEGAIQELYGLLLAHYAIRALLVDISLAPPR